MFHSGAFGRYNIDASSHSGIHYDIPHPHRISNMRRKCTFPVIQKKFEVGMDRTIYRQVVAIYVEN